MSLTEGGVQSSILFCLKTSF